MLDIRQILTQAIREYGPSVLPASAAAAFALIAAYQALESAGASSTTAGGMIYAWLSRYLLSWLGKGILIAGATVGTALMAWRIAWHHRVASNVAAVARISAVAVLMWVTHWCDALGGMVVGAVVAGMIMAVAAVARVQSDRGYSRNSTAGGHVRRRRGPAWEWSGLRR